MAGADEVARQEICIEGATTVATGIMIPHEAEIEIAAGLGILVIPSSTTRGLAALSAGIADIAMLAEPLESAAKRVRESKPGSLDLAHFEEFHLGDAQSQIIINGANPLTVLSSKEIAGLFSAAIRNWKEIGGQDQEVLVITEPTSTQHVLIARAYGFAYSSEAHEVETASETARLVAEAPGAISYLSTAHQVPERDRIKVVETGVSVPLRLYLAIRKDAGADVRKVIAATLAIGGVESDNAASASP